MKFRKSARIEAGLRQIDIVPLIDCVFLLLIFFMLTSSFIVIPGVNVNLPKVSASEKVENLTLTIAITSEDIFYLGGKPKTSKEVKDFIKEGGHSTIFIKADRDSSFGSFAKLYDICKGLGIKSISYAITSED
jgi:biopolymer transport protein ExbD